ncbi:hypothetical protein A3E96_00320 [Candidatus Uhrbacteria bacterium RIFCSPHIGHO2_12_FULL_46_13]|nr:MAG: hypothetical protein A3E96_00320 [Candidatus Uhrbacteria bacterium RIFCSPHIGHO2_12_FULL_46_13]
MDFLKKITTKQIWIYIAGAFVFVQILQHLLYDPLVDVLQALYLSLPAALQKLIYPISSTLAQLEPTAKELSVLFAIGAVEKLGLLIELSMIGALLWLVYRGVSKKWRKND